MGIAIGTFIQMPFYRLQNFFHNEVISWEGRNWSFAGFGYSGSSVDLQGGNVEAQLVFAVNTLSLQLAKTASDNRYMVRVKTVWLNPDTLVPESTFMEDRFMAIGFEHDSSRLALRLGSPLDAISGDVPRRRLTEKLVGALPSTGQIQLL